MPGMVGRAGRARVLCPLFRESRSAIQNDTDKIAMNARAPTAAPVTQPMKAPRPVLPGRSIAPMTAPIIAQKITPNMKAEKSASPSPSKCCNPAIASKTGGTITSRSLTSVQEIARSAIPGPANSLSGRGGAARRLHRRSAPPIDARKHRPKRTPEAPHPAGRKRSGVH